MRKIIAYSLIITLMLSITTVYATEGAAPIDERTFTLQSLGLIDEFEADKKVSRIEAVTAMVKMLMGDAPDAYEGDTGFMDVESNHPAAGYVYYGKHLGIIAGSADGIFEPTQNVTRMQIVKMAVATLGYQPMAEVEGGYPEGYLSVAAKYKLMRNMSGSYEEVTMQDMVYLLNNMLDTYPLEAVYGTENYRISETNLYEQIINRRNQSRVEGIVTAVGEMVIKEAKKLRENEISIDNVVYQYEGDDASNYLGKSITAYYQEDDKSVITHVRERDKNDELIINHKDIESFKKTKLTYEKSGGKTETIEIQTEASFIYNNRLYTPETDEVQMKAGEVRLIDNDNDGTYDVVFISEYESFIIDRISPVNNTIYFQKDVLYRGKSGFKFDYEARNKNYFIYDTEGNSMTFDELQENSIAAIQSDIEQDINIVIISKEAVQGEIREIISGEGEIRIDDTVYPLYEPNQIMLLSEFNLGQEGRFLLNHQGEIVGTDGQVSSESRYGYVAGVDGGTGLLRTPRLKLISAGNAEKVIEVSGDRETINYIYNNGEEQIFEFADKVNYTGPSMEKQHVKVENLRISSSSLNMNVFHRAAVQYQLNSEGKINKIGVTPIPIYETAKLAGQYAYNLNGKLNSFGGYSEKNAFFIGQSTKVICIPANNTPSEEDYWVDVTISDDSACTIVPIAINEKTQIAECAILIEKMDASTPKPFKESTKVSIVGKLIQGIDKEGELIYRLEVLTGNKLETPYIRSDSNNGNIVSGLQCGDLIKYNTKSSGEIDNITEIRSMANLGTDYDISREGSSEESVFAQAYSIVLNRLDDFRNEMVDILTIDTGSRKKSYTILREDAPTVYSYDKRTGTIMMAEIDEILTYDEIGSGASQVYMFVNQNNPEVIVLIKD